MKLYPLSRYELDQHVDAGLTNLSGTVDAIPHAIAAILWSIDRHVVEWTIKLFGAAFGVDALAAGSPLRIAVSSTARQLHAHVAQPLLTTAIVVAGLWSLWRLLVQREYADGVGKLAATLGYCLICLSIVLAPAATIGTLATSARQASSAVLAATLPGSGSTVASRVTDGLRASLIHEPWILLDFGATSHCVNAGGDPVESAGLNANGSARAPRGATCIDTRPLAARFLAHDPGSDERNEAFTTLDDGSDLERRAVRIQTGGSGYDRVAIALGLLIAACGAILLIGGLSLGMIAAQLYALVLLACAPIALLASFLPGHGHYIVRTWLGQLVGACLRSVVYCLYLSIAVSLSIALSRAGSVVGSVGVLTMQATLWWGLAIYGRGLSKRLGERAVSAPAARAVTLATQPLRMFTAAGSKG